MQIGPNHSEFTEQQINVKQAKAFEKSLRRAAITLLFMRDLILSLNFMGILWQSLSHAPQ